MSAMRLSYAPAAALATIVTTWRARVEVLANGRRQTRESSRAQYRAARPWSKATQVRLGRQQESGALPFFQQAAYNLTGSCACACEGTWWSPASARQTSLPHHPRSTLLPTLDGS